MSQASRIQQTAHRRERACPMCGSRAIGRRRSVPQKLAIDGRPLWLVTCADCGGIFQPEVPSDAELASWYEYMGHNPANLALSPLLRRRHRRLLSMLEPYRSDGRLLDVGCGAGLLLSSAAALGWHAHGTEISPSCCALLRPALGERLHQGGLTDTPFSPGSFDVVLMMEVIEHLAEPMEYLVAARRLLRRGGCLLLTTPHWGGITSRLYGDGWHVVADEHLSYFSIATMKMMLARSGFTNVRVTTTGLDVGESLRRLRRWMPAWSRRAPRTADAPTGNGQEVTTAAFKAAIADRLIECGNVALRSALLGDTIKTLATWS